MKATVSVSVVFTDLVGSTELLSRLGPTAGEELRTVHFGLLRDAVRATAGTEVKNLGDGLMVVYPSLVGALDGAVAMQQGVDRHNQRSAVELGIRVGLSTGDATVEDGDYFGEAVVEAARLCAKAAGGQILTTKTVSRLARRTPHRFEEVGVVDLKGLPEPVEVCDLDWEPTGQSARLRLPSRLAMAPAAGLLGRQEASRQLDRARDEAFSGGGLRVVLISGDAGIGKTSLVADLARRSHDDGARVLHGRCDDELRAPYQPFLEALDGLVSSEDEERLRGVGDRTLHQLVRILPSLRRRLPELPPAPTSDSDADRYLLLGAVTDLLVHAAADHPVLLVLEDLHWTERSAVQLLRHLVTSLSGAPILVVGTHRDSDITADHPLADGLAVLRREPWVSRIKLDGLDMDAVTALVGVLAGSHLAGAQDDLGREVWRETGGNPYFASEVLHHLVETAAQSDGAALSISDLASVGLPDSVREVIGRRVRRLPTAMQDLLSTASVLGRDFDLDLLARVADRNEDEVLDALEVAADMGLVTESPVEADRFAFSHALLQHTLYGELPASRRSRIHRDVGELLEQDLGDEPGDRVGELARHWMAATIPIDSGKAVAYARQAGDRALDALASHEALEWYRRALELLQSGVDVGDDDLPDVLIGLGTAQRMVGDACFRQTLLEVAADAIERGDADRLVAATLANQRGMVSSIGTVDHERIEMLERTLGLIDEADSSLRARMLAMLAAELTFAHDRPRLAAIAAQAESMSRRVGDTTTLLNVLNVLFLARWIPDDLEGTIERSLEASALALRGHDSIARFQAASNRAQMMASRADLAGMEDAIAEALALADEIGQPHMRWQARSLQCMIALLRGDAEAAERVAEEALGIGSESGQPDALVIYGANLINIRLHQGRMDEILPFIEQAAAESPGLPGFSAAVALAYCEAARLDDARPLLERAFVDDFQRNAEDYVWLTTTTVWAEVAVRVGHDRAAAVLEERLGPYEGQGISSGASFSGTVTSYLALLAAALGDVDRAVALFARADVQLRALGTPFWQARNQVDWARVLLSRSTGDDSDRAHALLCEASELSSAHGCAAVGRRAAALSMA